MMEIEQLSKLTVSELQKLWVQLETFVGFQEVDITERETDVGNVSFRVNCQSRITLSSIGTSNVSEKRGCKHC